MEACILKPTGYIEDMKLDMAGAAAVIGTIYVIAKMKLPVYVIGLVPSTDNAINNTLVCSRRGDYHLQWFDG